MLLSTEESNDFSKPLVFVNLLLILSECFKYETSVLDLILCFYTCDTCRLLKKSGLFLIGGKNSLWKNVLCLVAGIQKQSVKDFWYYTIIKLQQC